MRNYTITYDICREFFIEMYKRFLPLFTADKRILKSVCRRARARLTSTDSRAR